RETDPRLIRQRRLDAVLALRAVHLVVAARHVTAVQCGAERAEVDEKESACLRIATNSRVFPRDVGRRGDLDVDQKRRAAAADRHRVLRDVVLVMSRLVVMRHPREYTRNGSGWPRHGVLARRDTRAKMDGGDAARAAARTQLRTLRRA